MNFEFKDCPSGCYNRRQWSQVREGDPLRQLNRCCDPSCCIQRSIPRPSHLYSCSALSNLDTISSLPQAYRPSAVHYCNLQDGEWNSCSLFKPKRHSSYENWADLPFEDRERHSSILREKYKREIEVLKEKLNAIKSNVMDGKRNRHRCESEPGTTGMPILRTPLKRARDLSPAHMTSHSRQARSPCRSPTLSRNNFKRETRSMPPRLPTSLQPRQRLPHLPAITNRHEESRRVPLDLSSSEESIYDDVSVSGESVNNISEDDLSIQSDLTCPSNESNTSSNEKFSNASIAQEEASSFPLFRQSLFTNVPPYLNFSSHDLKGPIPPPELARLLKWKLSTITPVVIRRTLTNSGFKFVRKSNDWVGQWGKHMNSFLFKTLKDFQKLNHFPGTFHIGRKDKLWKNLNRLMLKFGKKEFGFIPTTYILPQDSKSLRIAWEKAGSKGQWIVKPPAAARGTGIRVVHRWSDIPKNKPMIVQKYISQPYLINGSKFDLRLYVLMTSVHPLRIYLYDDGLVRFASVKYSNNMESLSDRFMHLTNYSINKLSNQYCANEDASSCQGHKWTLKSLWVYLKKEGVNVNALKKNLTDLVVKTIISGESHIQTLSKNNLPSRYCSYELFGIDVLLDSNLRPWLLEVNISPSLHSSSPLDLAVKGPLVRELFNLAGFQIPAKLTKEQELLYLARYGLDNQTSKFCYDKRLYTTSLSRDERIKHASHNLQPRSAYQSSILENLTADDVRHLIQFEDELTQLERFEKVYPTAETYIYQQFFDSPRYYNMLFDSWECKYENNREVGIRLLNILCQGNFHLQVPFTGGKTKTSLNRSLAPADTADETESSHEESLRTLVKRRKMRLMGRTGIRLLVPRRNRCRVASGTSNLPKSTLPSNQLQPLNVSANS